MRTLTALALVMAVCGGGAASAAVPKADLFAIDTLRNVNAVIYGDASTQADIEGRAIIGGNYSGASMYNHPPTTAWNGYGALTVYGSTSGNDINIDNGGSAYVGGNQGAHINFNSGGGNPAGGYLPSVPNTITDFQNAFASFSSDLQLIPQNSFLPTPGNQEVITATPNARGVAVFDITTAQLMQIPSYSINLNGAKSVVFNVSGASLNFNANEQFNASSLDSVASTVIFNFYQATSLVFGAQIAGAILAPNAYVRNSNQIDGALVAKNFSGGGELHYHSYTGEDPEAVPEPGTWALMLTGIGLVGGGLRVSRRKRAALVA